MLLGLVGTGVGISAWPDSDPMSSAPSATSPAEVRLDRSTRELSAGRPALDNSSRPADETARRAAQAETKTKAAAKAKAAARAKAAAKAKTEARAKAKSNAAAKAKSKAAAKALARADARARSAAAAKKRQAAARLARKRAAATKAQSHPSSAQLRVVGHLYTRVALNARRGPSATSPAQTVLRTGSTVAVTRTTTGSWTLVRVGGRGLWVHTRYLTASKPRTATADRPVTKQATTQRPRRSSTRRTSASGLSMSRCSSGPGREAGLTRDAIRVHRAVCARYPQVRSYGGRRSGGGDSYHTTGRAVDIMISGSSTGWAIARWVRANHRRLGVSEVIFSQRIWTVQRSGEGWRSMSDRGNATANHYDHVHVSVYGSAGTS